ncbi:MAG: hypothetical protein AB8B60_10010 [Sulfitobacter sp.]
MKVSANEVVTLATKAARGGGAPPGQAADFGRAALRHLLEGRTPAALSHALAALPNGPILTLPLQIARLLEQAGERTATGFLPIEGNAELAESYVQSQPFAAETRHSDAAMSVTFSLDAPNNLRAVARVDLSDALAQQMQHLAAKILVPESAASRLSGAGAGLTDND